MLSLTKMRKKLLSKKQYKIIKGFNSQGNFVSFKSEVDSSTFLEGKNAVGESSIKKTKVGLCTFIGSGCEMNNCKIGRFCSISSSVRVVANTHPLDFVSTYSGFYKSIMPRYPFGNVDFAEFLKTDGGFSCVIGNDVWIGRDVLIRGGGCYWRRRRNWHGGRCDEGRSSLQYCRRRPVQGDQKEV